MRKMLICCLLLGMATQAMAKDQYAIVIDAGSSGSRVHLYQYDKEKPLNLAIKEIAAAKIKPGISSFADKPSEVRENFKTLMNVIKLTINDKDIQLSDVPVSVLATAGMRLLPQQKQQAIYHELKDVLSNELGYRVDEVKTISGKMEGVYGWLTLNNLNHRFTTKKATDGFIDIGGASIQIAFNTNDKRYSADTIEVSVKGKKYNVFSKSYLGLGLDQSRKAMNTHPNYSSCYPANYVIKGNQVTSDLGNFKFDACQTIYLDIIPTIIKSKTPKQAYSDTFYATSGAYYTYQFFNQENTPSNIDSAIETVCSQTWETLKAHYSKLPEKFLNSYCANGVYLSALFGKSDLLSKNVNLKITNVVNQQEIEWTEGVILNKYFQD